MNEIIEKVDLGIYIADAENVKYQFYEETLIFSFVDINNKYVEVKCENVLGFRYQKANYTYSSNESFDSCHIVHNSSWLKLHQSHGETWDNEKWLHYKLNFNAECVIEVLCTKIQKL